MAEIFSINTRRRDVLSITTASNHNELVPRMTDAFIHEFPEYRQIPLSKGYYAIVDTENYEWLMQWKWSASITGRTVYAKRTSSIKDGPYKSIHMHRVIINAPEGTYADHWNGNGLMNTFDNLRRCTKAQNGMNSPVKNIARGKTSKYKGVHWFKPKSKWTASIRAGGRSKHLGYFKDETDAARAYNKAALEHFGEFARINAIDGAA